jgi:hypothetical protein
MSYSRRHKEKITRSNVELLISNPVRGPSLKNEVDLVHRRMAMEFRFDALLKRPDRHLCNPWKDAAPQQYLFWVSVA